ncbi:MAG: glyoxalase, partial [Myxococcota bacterium]
MPRFHLAFPVADLEATRTFFVDLLDARVGRESDRWLDFDFYGHQLSAHLSPEEVGQAARNPVDGHAVPV